MLVELSNSRLRIGGQDSPSDQGFKGSKGSRGQRFEGHNGLGDWPTPSARQGSRRPMFNDAITDTLPTLEVLGGLLSGWLR